jgi:(heptosyl)LPS beta-1,4-glucosyltransferase
MNRASLTVCLIVRNESSNIDDCLESISWADEIVVIDGGSSDDTAERARRHGARVESAADWRGFGIQRQRAQALASCDWVLMLDADERVTPALAAEIQDVLRNDDRYCAYTLPRLSWCFGRYIHHGGWYPDHVLRLYPRNRARYNDALVHERVVLDVGMRVESLKNDLLHFTYENMNRYLVKSAQYAAAWAEQRQRRGRKASLLQGIYHAIGCFLRMYVFRLGLLDGRAGLLLALLSAHSTFVKYADLWVRGQPERPEVSSNRILQLCLSDGHGGLELYVARLSTLLRERGRDCRAIVAPGTLLAQRLDEQLVSTRKFRTWFDKFPLIAAMRLARYFERERIDVVHIHWSRDLPLAALAKRLSRRRVRLVHSRHMNITRGKHDLYHRFIYGEVDCYITLSKTMLDDARRHLPLEPQALELVYLGVPTPEQDASKAEPRAEGPLAIGQFGRIEHGKGQHVLIEAMKILRDRGVNAQARIIGHAMDPTYLASLKEEVQRNNLQDMVTFADFVPSAQRMMPEFDVIVLASERESFGLVLIEAMRGGVAVIGTNAGGVPEIIEHGESGLLFDPGSAVSLADNLQFLAEHPEELRRIAAAGRERADHLFAEEAHIARIESLLIPGLADSAVKNPEAGSTVARVFEPGWNDIDTAT